MKKGFLLLAGFFFLLVLVGCAGGRVRRGAVGSEVVVKREPEKKPEWTGMPYEEKKDKLFFKGEANKVYDKALGFTEAKANAIQNLIEAIKIKARSEFSKAIKGVNVSQSAIGQYLDNVIAWTSDNLSVSGVIPVHEYYEKVQVTTHEGVKYHYNCYVQLSISLENYIRAREKALNNAAETAADPEAKELAEEVKKRLLSE